MVDLLIQSKAYRYLEFRNVGQMVTKVDETEKVNRFRLNRFTYAILLVRMISRGSNTRWSTIDQLKRERRLKLHQNKTKISFSSLLTKKSFLKFSYIFHGKTQFGIIIDDQVTRSMNDSVVIQLFISVYNKASERFLPYLRRDLRHFTPCSTSRCGVRNQGLWIFFSLAEVFLT